MKFSIDRRFFADQLNVVLRAIPVVSPITAMKGVLIQLAENEMILTGTGNEISIQTIIVPGEINRLTIEEPGIVDVEAKYFGEIIRKMDCSSVTIETSGSSIVRITSDNGIYNLNSFDVVDYPSIDFSAPEMGVVLPQSKLKEIINQTAFCCSEKDNRPVLTGVNFNAQDGVLTCASTDSYRLAKKVIDLESDDFFNITIPKKSLLEIYKSLTDNPTDKIHIYADRQKVQMVIDKTIFQCRLLEGRFPEVNRIIPVNKISALKFDANEMIRAIDRTNFIRNEKVYLVQMDMNAAETRLKTMAEEIGSSNESLYKATYSGEDLNLHLNGVYLLEAIKAIHQDNVTLEFTGQLSPIKIYSENDPSVTMVVVPIRSY